MKEIKLTNQLQERSQEDSSRKEESSNESQPIQPTQKQMTDTNLGAFFNKIADIINPVILQVTTGVYNEYLKEAKTALSIIRTKER